MLCEIQYSVIRGSVGVGGRGKSSQKQSGQRRVMMDEGEYPTLGKLRSGLARETRVCIVYRYLMGWDVFIFCTPGFIDRIFCAITVGMTV